MDVFPALLESDVPFYSHEITAYWNDIGNLAELRQGNLDALHGEVAVDSGAPEVADGVRSASPIDDVEVTPPVLVGAGVEIGDGARLEGPVIVGNGCRIGAGAVVRDSILLEAAELAAGSILIGGIAARVTGS
jgi:NDP-sugar pyrophosphorylase family protein